jgi:hypothetical protein
MSSTPTSPLQGISILQTFQDWLGATDGVLAKGRSQSTYAAGAKT